MMLFGHEDRRILSETYLRKLMESVDFAEKGTLSRIGVSYVAKSICLHAYRVDCMYRICINDLADIDHITTILQDDSFRMSPLILPEYHAFIDPGKLDDECYVMALEHLVDDFTPMLVEAEELSQLMVGGFDPITDTDKVDILRIRDLMTRLREDCPLDDPDVPYRSARNYMDHLIFEANVLLRIGAFKEVSNEDCSLVVDGYYTYESEDFESIFLDRMTEEEVRLYHRYHLKEYDRAKIAVARCIVNCSMDIVKVDA